MSDKAPAGFTLLEVLVALAILGFSLGALLPRLSLAGSAADKAGRTEQAMMLAEDLHGQWGRTIRAGIGERVSGRSEDGLEWTLAVCCARSMGDGRNGAAIADIVVEVRWGRRHVASLTTRRLVAGAE